MHSGQRTIANIDEILRLEAQYPPLPPDPGDPLDKAIQAFRVGEIKSLREERRQLEIRRKKHPDRLW